MPGFIGIREIVLLLVLLLLIFRGKRLPEMGAITRPRDARVQGRSPRKERGLRLNARVRKLAVRICSAA